jgi:hypothetical protein
MNIQPLFRVLIAALLAALIQGCATAPKTGQAALVGTWTNTLGSTWMIKADGTYDADINKDGKRDAWGELTVDGNTMTVWRTGGIRPKGCDGKGVYQFTRDRAILQFTLVKDSCRLRRKNVLQTWRRK